MLNGGEAILLYGSVGLDTLIGGLGTDMFDYNFIAESAPGFWCSRPYHRFRRRRVAGGM